MRMTFFCIWKGVCGLLAPPWIRRWNSSIRIKKFSLCPVLVCANSHEFVQIFANLGMRTNIVCRLALCWRTPANAASISHWSWEIWWMFVAFAPVLGVHFASEYLTANIRLYFFIFPSSDNSEGMMQTAANKWWECCKWSKYTHK